MRTLPEARTARATSRRVFVAAYVALTGLVVLQVVLSNAAMGAPLHLRGFLAVRLAETAVGIALALGSLALVDRLAPVERTGIGGHLAAAFTALAPAALAVGSLPRLLPVLGVPLEFRGSVGAKAVSELVSLGLALTLAVALDVHARWRARESHALQLEARLAEARLQALASQLHPHFLFNTLNAVSVILHRDPRAADAMLVGLAELLRATLGRRDEHEIPLRQELALLDHYLRIMRHRYGERLTIEVEVAPETGDLLVPPFVLQPLVENALEHGIGRRAGPGRVRVHAERRDGRLRLEVVDDGAGLATPRREGDGAGGIGLSTTRRRLEELYGASHRLELEAGIDGRGARVVVELPARRAGGTTGSMVA